VSVKRYGMIHSDGSMTIFSESTDLDRARREWSLDDPNERDLRKRAKLVHVDVRVITQFGVELPPAYLPVSKAGGELIRGAQKLHCDDQFAIATAVAANVGYVLAPEPKIES